MSGYVGITVRYTPVEYIESTGTQYIDTGFKHNQNTRMLADIDFQPTTAWEKPFGSWGGPNTSPQKRFGSEYNGSQVNAYYAQRSNQAFTTYRGRLTWDFNKNVFKVGTVTKTFSASTFQSQYNDLIFGLSDYNGGAAVGAKMKLYSFKMYDNGTLVRDFIPVLDENNVACLYDLVHHKFYYNAGSGTFNYGTTSSKVESNSARKIKKAYVGVPITYTPVEYIGNSGTQYIDTEVLMKDTLKIEGEFCNVSDYGYWYGARDNISSSYPRTNM